MYRNTEGRVEGESVIIHHSLAEGTSEQSRCKNVCNQCPVFHVEKKMVQKLQLVAWAASVL